MVEFQRGKLIDGGGGEDNPTRAAVLHPDLKSSVRKDERPHSMRAAPSRLEEALGLAEAINLEIVVAEIVTVNRVRPATLFGSGKVEELKGMLVAADAELVIVDAALTPVQQRNLEKAWGKKVIDRTGLILEIFSERAQTREGVLQVELAHLTYQKSRLVRSWTHLERQRGGLGFVGGPGETQIEADRRLIDERIVKLKRQLERVKGTRSLHRQSRKKVPYPVVALVGYTNAGKSTLFNALTKAEVFAKDLLFATLDPTMRSIELSGGKKVILSDTVGFISDLPTDLIAAFRATLEEVIEADIILHVRDLASPESDEQRADVLEVMRQLGITSDDGNIIEVHNKIDLLDKEEKQRVCNHAERDESIVALSALSGEGLEDLNESIESFLSRSDRSAICVLGFDEGDTLSWIYRNTKVLERVDGEDGTRMKFSASEAVLDKLSQRVRLNIVVEEEKRAAQ